VTAPIVTAPIVTAPIVTAPARRTGPGAASVIRPNADTDQALASLDTLRAIHADLLLPGHGDPWSQGVAETVRKAKAAGPS
jgi:glyoxylase-like metal-dependent hydrolase (beta-lactamase superfamily II)